MTLSKHKNLKYKAIIFDIDGTLIPINRYAIPSKKVTETINKARKLIHIGVATSRCLTEAKSVVNHLNLSGPSILNGGAQIISFPSGKYLFQQPLIQSDLFNLCDMFKKFNLSFILCDGENPDILHNGKLPQKTFMLYSQALDSDILEQITKAISHISTISIFTTRSWITGKTDILVSHAKATKQHAILEIAKILNINTHEIIGVGDGYNDFPLLMACGLKVAMGNAVPELKEIADYIAPPVEKDGVADIIEKFVL